MPDIRLHAHSKEKIHKRGRKRKITLETWCSNLYKRIANRFREGREILLFTLPAHLYNELGIPKNAFVTMQGDGKLLIGEQLLVKAEKK